MRNAGITNEIATWHARFGSRYFTFTDRSSADMTILAEAVIAAVEQSFS